MSRDSSSRQEPLHPREAAEEHDAGVSALILLRVADVLDSVIEITGRAAAWLALAMVLVIAFNVLRRYVLGVSTVAMQELEWHLMVPLVLFGLAYTMRHREHVRVDFLYDHFPRRMQDAVDSLSGVATVIISVLMIDFSLDYVSQSLAMNEGSPDPGGLSHRYLLKAFIPVGFGLLAVEGGAVALRHAVFAVRGRPRDG